MVNEKDTELYNEELRSEESLRGRPGRLSRVPPRHCLVVRRPECAEFESALKELLV